MPNKPIKQLISWSAVIVMMATIFYLSSQPASQSFNLSQDMIYVTIQVVKVSQLLMVVVLAYAAIKLLKHKQIKIGLKELILLIVVLILLYSVSGILLRYFAPVDLHHFVRKNAHFFIYLVLGFLSKTALKSNGYTGWKSSIMAVTGCVLYALSDELHQTIVPGRGGMLSDVVIDSAGASIGIVAQSLWNKIKKVVDHKKLVQT
ncbi:VanZ family protein [Carnobacterium funditum]|uniref:VanZ family protein n=1 Tax=Carnobacterium funditum TaxID=2752 RepID=UPI0006916E3F|nr:VanZ family protein [Carnobacterium funditum]